MVSLESCQERDSILVIPRLCVCFKFQILRRENLIGSVWDRCLLQWGWVSGYRQGKCVCLCVCVLNACLRNVFDLAQWQAPDLGTENMGMGGTRGWETSLPGLSSQIVYFELVHRHPKTAVGFPRTKRTSALGTCADTQDLGP